MTPPPRASRLPGLALLGAALLWAALLCAPHLSTNASGLDRLEASLLDARFTLVGGVAPVPDVVVVAVDDATLNAAEQGAGSNRLLIARTLTAIAAAGPRVIGLDVILADSGDGDVDATLASALSAAPTVIAAGGSFASSQTGSGIAAPTRVLRPQPGFAAVADVGLVNLSTDTTGVPRHVPAALVTEQGVEPSFALRLAARFVGEEPVIATDTLQLGSNSVPLDVGFNMPLRLVGPRGSIATFSAADVLAGTHSDALAGKVVVLGYTATAFGDRFPTPYGESVPGVEIMATAVSQMLGGPTLRRDQTIRRLDVGASVALALLGTALVVFLPLSLGVPLALGAMAVWGGVVVAAFSRGLWLSAALPLACTLLPFASAVVLRYLLEKRKATRGAAALAALKQFQSPALAEMIADDPAFLKHPTARRLSIFFVDLSGFTQLSERLGPARTQDLLKQFHQITAAAVEAEQGIVLNYMGDGALAVFGMTGAGAGSDTGRSADQALRTAFALVSDLGALGQGVFTVGCRIGLHHGEVVLSRLGGDHHQQVSVAGDTVNLASRLLEIAKAETAAIAATEQVLQATSTPPLRPADKVRPVSVRGRDEQAIVSFWTV